MLATPVSYRILSQNLERTLANTARQPSVERETGYYLDNIGKVKSINDFIKDDRLFSYAMKAFGLEKMTYAKAFMRKVLTEGVDGDRAFANTLSDQKYREFARAFNFKAYGAAATAFDSAGKDTAAKFVRQTLEEQAGAQNEGVRLALYFQRKASVGLTAHGILGDAALTKVVQTALGLPAIISSADIDKQAALITAKVDLDGLRDPVKLDRFLVRFTSLWEIENGSAGSTANAALLIGQPREGSVTTGLLTSLQSLRRGGR